MAISPNQQERLANEIRRIYEDAEVRLLMMIAKRLVSGSGDIAEWQTEKMNQLAVLLKDARKVTNDLDKEVVKTIQQLIELAYLAGNDSALGDVQQALKTIEEEDIPVPLQIQMALFPLQEPTIDITAVMETFSGINTDAIEALAGVATKTVTDTHVPILRKAEDIYRRIVSEVVGSVLTGVETRIEATQRILNRFSDEGVKTFVTKPDKNGKRRRYDMATYSEMATRTAIGQASLQGHINKMVEMGFDLIQVSNHKEECELCRPWEGKVLSVSGNDNNHPSLAEATRAGLFHTYCGHRANTYFEGLTTPLEKTEDPEGAEQRDRQRALERAIRKWKKRQSVAITEHAKKQADAKVKEWTEAMEDFIEETGRRRKRQREQITKAR